MRQPVKDDQCDGECAENKNGADAFGSVAVAIHITVFFERLGLSKGTENSNSKEGCGKCKRAAAIAQPLP